MAADFSTPALYSDYSTCFSKSTLGSASCVIKVLIRKIIRKYLQQSFLRKIYLRLSLDCLKRKWNYESNNWANKVTPNIGNDKMIIFSDSSYLKLGFLAKICIVILKIRPY